MMQRTRLLLLVLIAILLVACGGGDDEKEDDSQEQVAPETPSVGGTPIPQFTGLPAWDFEMSEDPDSVAAKVTEPVIGSFRLPTIEGLNAKLAFTQGSALYIASFNRERARLVNEVVDPTSLSLSPDSRYLTYVTTLAGVPTVVRLNTETLEEIPLLPVAAGINRVLSWSADGQWVLIAGAGQGALTVVSVDGSVVKVLVPEVTSGAGFVPFPEAAWLNDNRVVYIDLQEEEAATLMIYDPTTDEATPIDIALNPANPRDLLALEAALREEAVYFARTFNNLNRATSFNNGDIRAFIEWPEAFWNLATQPCDDWQILQGESDSGEFDRAYAISNVTYLSDLTALPDGTLLFLEWSLPLCSPTSNPQIVIKQIKPGEAMRTVGDNVAAQNGRDLNTLAYDHSNKLSISPDGRYVVWVSGSLWSGESGIEISDLQTGQHATLIRAAVPSETSLLTNVLWIGE